MRLNKLGYDTVVEDVLKSDKKLSKFKKKGLLLHKGLHMISATDLWVLMDKVAEEKDKEFNKSMFTFLTQLNNFIYFNFPQSYSREDK